MTNLVSTVLSPAAMAGSAAHAMLDRIMRQVPEGSSVAMSKGVEEALFQQLLGLSRLMAQYNSVLEALNDPHSDVNLQEFHGDF